jgi:hypothetical protein
MSSPRPVPKSTWEVISTQRVLDPGAPLGQTRYVYEVSFRTGAGAEGVITVAEAAIGDRTSVMSQIAGKAAQLDAIHTLKSE